MESKHTPYWEGAQPHAQRLYRFPNGHGASVVKRGDGHEMAAIRLTGDKSFWLNYHTDFGPPRSGLSEEDVEAGLDQIAALPAAPKIDEGKMP